VAPVKLKAVCFSTLLCLSMMFLAKVASAQEVQPLEPDWLLQMYEEGWQKVQEGVLRRDVREGRFETFGYGAEGLQWLVEHYRQQLTYFESKYRESPSEELASLLDGLTDKINTLQGDALAASAAESFDGPQIDGCSFTYDATASAGPLTSAQGVTAAASAYFQGTCEITANITALAYAHSIQGTQENTTTQLDPKSGTWVESNATASANGSTGCESRAQASVEIPSLGIFYSTPEVTNYLCPDQVSISGPAQIATDYYGQACADVTWTASTTSGRTDYTFEWYFGTALAGTGPTLTKRYCNETRNETVQVVARDSTSWSDDATFTTSIRYTGPVVASVSGPATVTTDYYSSPCATVTWTASATGGHPGYTYNWYVDTSATSQGTSSSFTYNYCGTGLVTGNASPSVMAKVVVTDSDGHTANSTFTTNVQYRAAIVAAITGPATVSTNTSTPCANVTWTASASGSGHSGYTYNWYLGTSTTLQGTGSTFTKSYCSTTTKETVTLVATASDGHADDETFTTNITHTNPPPLAASISGQSTVDVTYQCYNLTWNANVSGGAPAYSYSWTIGTSTTVLSTTSTLTKTVCTGGTLNVKLTVIDSASQTANATFTTTVYKEKTTNSCGTVICRF
jgi:hypothetical protein